MGRIIKLLILTVICSTLLMSCGEKKEEVDEFAYYGSKSTPVDQGEDDGNNAESSSQDDSEVQTSENVRAEEPSDVRLSEGRTSDNGNVLRSKENIDGPGKYQPHYVERSGLDTGSVAAGYLMGTILNSPQREVIVIQQTVKTSQASVKTSGNSSGIKTTQNPTNRKVLVKGSRKTLKKRVKVSRPSGKIKRSYSKPSKKKRKRSRKKSRSRKKRRRR